MARLTWQNVNAPNFSGVADSYRVMSDLLGRAAQSGQNALGVFQNAYQGAADNAILQRMAGVQDPAQWDANSIIGTDGANASSRVLAGVADRPGTLLNWAINRENLNQTQYTNRRGQEGDAWQDRHAADLNNAAVMASRGDMAGAQGRLHYLSGTQGARPDLIQAALDNASSSAQSANTRERFGWDRENRSDQELAMRHIQQINAAGSFDQADRNASLERARRELANNPRAFELVQRGINGQGGWADAYALPEYGVGGGAGAVPTGSNPTQRAGTGAQPSAAVSSAIQSLSSEFPEISPNFMAAMSMIETRGGTVSDRSGSQYQGTFQLGDSVRQQYGVTDPQDINQNTRAAYQYARDNARSLSQHLGVPPEQVPPELLYLAHQQGATGIRNIIAAAREGTAISDLPAGLRKNVESNIPASQKGNIKTAQDFINYYSNRMKESGATPEQLRQIQSPADASQFEPYWQEGSRQIGGALISEQNVSRMVQERGAEQVDRFLASNGRIDPEVNGVKMSDLAKRYEFENTPRSTRDTAAFTSQAERSVGLSRQLQSNFGSDLPALLADESSTPSIVNRLIEEKIFPADQENAVGNAITDLVATGMTPAMAGRLLERQPRRNQSFLDHMFSSDVRAYRPGVGSKVDQNYVNNLVDQFRNNPNRTAEMMVGNRAAAMAANELPQLEAQISRAEQDLMRARANPNYRNRVGPLEERLRSLHAQRDRISAPTSGARQPSRVEEVMSEVISLMGDEYGNPNLTPQERERLREDVSREVTERLNREVTPIEEQSFWQRLMEQGRRQSSGGSL